MPAALVAEMLGTRELRGDDRSELTVGAILPFAP
jgi:hypothetical protein